MTFTELRQKGLFPKSKFVIVFPTSFSSEELFLEYHEMPSDIFTHKEYPICMKCKDKYVPIKKGDFICFKCQFTDK